MHKQNCTQYLITSAEFSKARCGQQHNTSHAELPAPLGSYTQKTAMGHAINERDEKH